MTKQLSTQSSIRGGRKARKVRRFGPYGLRVVQEGKGVVYIRAGENTTSHLKNGRL